MNNRVCFPFIETGNEIRSYEDYLLMRNEEHRVSSTISCLVLIPNVDVVNLFSLDYMHLVCLGVMKKLLNPWLQKGPLHARLPSLKSKQITINLLKIKNCITNDFARKPRGIDEVNRFKANEFRQLLLYTGPIVFKNILSEDSYQHFLILSISMRILLRSDYAHQLLKYFVKTFQQIYGCNFLSHNVHGLLHLVEDYTRHGPLDNCSAFPFENYMKELKRMLRKNEKTLQQVVRRYKEQQNTKEIGQLNDDDHLKLKVKEPVCFVLTYNGNIVKITEFLSDNEIFVGQAFTSKEDMFIKPLKSSKLDIFIVKNLSVNLSQWKITDIRKKMIIFNLDNILTAVPIIILKHSLIFIC